MLSATPQAAAGSTPGGPRFPQPESCRARGGEACFSALFQEYRPRLEQFFTRRLGSREDAEDAVMLTFQKAWRARAQFRGEVSEKNWLFGIAARVAVDEFRRRRARPATCGLESELPAEERALEETCSQSAAVNAALASLPPDGQRLLRLFYLEGWKQEEIGAALGLSEATVRGRLHRLRHALRARLPV